MRRNREFSGADNRPRFHVRPTMDGGCAWRKGIGGLERPAVTVGAAVDTIMVEIQHGPAVIFWEGKADG
jgi:hypothetical protein